MGGMFLSLNASEKNMDLETFAEVLAHFPRSPKTAKTVKELAASWQSEQTDQAKLRHLYRCVNELSSGVEPVGNFVCKIPRPDHAARDEGARVFLNLPEISDFFMSDAIALQILLGRRTINPALVEAGAIEADAVAQIARERLADNSSHASTLANKIRVAPDGIDRLLAKIDPEVLRVMLEALVRKKKVEFDYRSSKGNLSRKKLGVLGLVVKDGSIYLLGLEGIKDTPGAALPLHRMSNARVDLLQPFHHAPFDIDAWLEKNGQLSHPIGDIDKTIRLEFLVAPQSVWHFEERPLGPDQVITAPDTEGEWHHITVTTKHWYTLTSFLASFGPYIKVLGPPEVLEGEDGIANWARQMAALYG